MKSRRISGLGLLGSQFMGLYRWRLFGKTKGWGSFHSCVNLNITDHSHSSAILGSASWSLEGARGLAAITKAISWLILELSQMISPVSGPFSWQFLHSSHPIPHVRRNVTVRPFIFSGNSKSRKEKRGSFLLIEMTRTFLRLFFWQLYPFSLSPSIPVSLFSQP